MIQMESFTKRGMCVGWIPLWSTRLTFLQATWKTPLFREYHRRMQIFILLYIEAGSYINEAEDAWEFVILCVFDPLLAKYPHASSSSVLTKLDTKSANDSRRHLSRSLITLSDTPPFILSTAFLTKSASV